MVVVNDVIIVVCADVFVVVADVIVVVVVVPGSALVVVFAAVVGVVAISAVVFVVATVIVVVGSVAVVPVAVVVFSSVVVVVVFVVVVVAGSAFVFVAGLAVVAFFPVVDGLTVDGNSVVGRFVVTSDVDDSFAFLDDNRLVAAPDGCFVVRTTLSVDIANRVVLLAASVVAVEEFIGNLVVVFRVGSSLIELFGTSDEDLFGMDAVVLVEIKDCGVVVVRGCAVDSVVVVGGIIPVVLLVRFLVDLSNIHVLVITGLIVRVPFPLFPDTTSACGFLIFGVGSEDPAATSLPIPTSEFKF